MLNARLNRTPLTRPARLAAAIALLTVTVPIAGFGAQTFGTVSGTIADQFGGVIPSTTVTLSNDASQIKHEVKSDATGHFQFVGLTAGDYVLEVNKAAGFAPVRDAVTLAAGQTLLRNLVLQVGSLQETITVTDERSSTSALQTRERPRPATIPSKACTPSSVGGRIVPPTKVYDVKPRFPQSLHDANATAQVELEARIGTDGSVKELRTVATVDPDAESAAKTAVSQWLFTPTLLNCIPIEVIMKTRVYFGRP